MIITILIKKINIEVQDKKFKNNENNENKNIEEQ